MTMLVETALGTEDIEADGKLSGELRDAVERLPPKQQEAVKLVYLERLKPVEAAAKADCSRKLLDQRLVDARIQLRRLLRCNRPG